MRKTIKHWESIRNVISPSTTSTEERWLIKAKIRSGVIAIIAMINPQSIVVRAEIDRKNKKKYIRVIFFVYLSGTIGLG
ncbi:MAG: hypothetical protein COX77_02535 [Candidatus Komeilibacteria bacterium CG_4_10_14_0_2_um_filter_37_10]|uniref:Uncharacterized protein n=1 Tax=Candidatus Komeilibacteria bacterium CG_4_10_14_0_2_um_filter_37_10 TaxID=1974470 RepID=A0A2M7VEW8_9BACT|nr:MAG: hypothetical protein COX77_02535 [Candidatus Komeilibacteria bacterium CG_4_10_14_0_2_um_filter_37_10]